LQASNPEQQLNTALVCVLFAMVTRMRCLPMRVHFFSMFCPLLASHPSLLTTFRLDPSLNTLSALGVCGPRRCYRPCRCNQGSGGCSGTRASSQRGQQAPTRTRGVCQGIGGYSKGAGVERVRGLKGCVG
jgi:hypothetical protein